MEQEPNESQPSRIVVRPEFLAIGLGLSCLLVLMLTSRLRRLEQENNTLRQNYRGVVDVVNQRRVPCPCQETNGKAAAQAPPETYQTVPGSAQLPPDLPVEEGRS